MNIPPKTLAESCQREASHLLKQSLRKIEHCLNQIDEDQVWKRLIDSGNSIGNQLLHMAGNLQQWAVSGVGGTEDNRTREEEFSARGGMTKSELLDRLQHVVQQADKVLETISEDRWLEHVTIQGFETSVHSAINHTTSHFVGHTHQIILTTRVLLGDKYQFHWSPDDDKTNVPI